jgi:hypothetical protein
MLFMFFAFEPLKPLKPCCLRFFAVVRPPCQLLLAPWQIFSYGCRQFMDENGDDSMLQDRFVKIMLVVIAALLALNLLRPGTSVVTTPATAQIINTTPPALPMLDIKPVRGYQVAGLKDVVAVGDGRSFVVSRSDGFMVYQVSDPNLSVSSPSQQRY